MGLGRPRYGILIAPSSLAAYLSIQGPTDVDYPALPNGAELAKWPELTSRDVPSLLP